MAARFSGAGGIAPEPDPAAAAFTFDARTGAEPFPFDGNHDEPLAGGEGGNLGRAAPLVGGIPDEEDAEQEEEKGEDEQVIQQGGGNWALLR